MPDIFGAPAGLMAAAQERRLQDLHQISMEKGEIENAQARMALESQKRMLDMMNSGAAPGGPPAAGGAVAPADDMAGKMDRLAQIALSAGLPEKAKDYASTASTLRKNAGEITKTKFETDVKEMELMGQLLDGVEDQTSWQRANAIYQIQTGKASPFARLPYNEQLVGQLKIGVQSAKDRAQIAADKAREKSALASAKESETRVGLIKAQTRLADQRTKALVKAGATAAMPKASSMKTLTDMMAKEFVMMPEEARVLARPMAEEMEKLVKDQGMTYTEAASKVYDEAKARGDFGGYKILKAFKGTFKNPMPLPKDPKQLKANMFYTTPKGVVLFNGKGFETEPKEEVDNSDVVTEEDEDTMPAVEPEEQ